MRPVVVRGNAKRQGTSPDGRGPALARSGYLEAEPRVLVASSCKPLGQHAKVLQGEVHAGPGQVIPRGELGATDIPPNVPLL